MRVHVCVCVCIYPTWNFVIFLVLQPVFSVSFGKLMASNSLTYAFFHFLMGFHISISISHMSYPLPLFSTLYFSFGLT